MKLKDLYNKKINRTVNPAVSATKLDDPDTIQTEIEEYVFTDEIINGLYRILDAIKNNKPYDHVGIWIDGYYGSGKSHFLKYLDYCITPRTRDDALSRLLEAVKSIDPAVFSYPEREERKRWSRQKTQQQPFTVRYPSEKVLRRSIASIRRIPLITLGHAWRI